MLSRAVEVKTAAGSETGRSRSVDGDYDEGLYNELSALRRQISGERGVPAYVIFGNRALQDMARKVPRTPAEFSRVSGVGRAKLEDLGEPFLKLINSYARERGWPEAQTSTNRSDVVERTPRVVNQSYRETGRLISEGASLSDAAAARGLKPTTVLGHLERLVEEGVPVNLAHVLPAPDRRVEIEAALGALGDNPLRPVWEELEGRYSYDEIRLVRLARRNASQATATEALDARERDSRSMMGR